MKTKFRAWDKKYNKWVSCNIVLEYSGVLFWTQGDTFTIIDYPNKRYVVQLFTGLTDKNGKEYYRKDIFKYDNLIYCVEYNFGGFGYYDHSQIWRWLYEIADKSEIIGNAFENPELLK